MIITPPATVLLAFIRQPLTMPSGEKIYMAELMLPAPLADVMSSFVEAGQCVYVVTSRTQPGVFDVDGQPFALTAEIGPGSIVRMALLDPDRVMTAVSVIRLVTHNPFAEMAG